MKFYKCSKKILNFSDMTQITGYDWNLPILIDINRNVLLGNSLKDSLPEEVYVVIYHYDNETLRKALWNIENGVAVENSKERIHLIITKLRNFFRDVRKPKIEQMSLIDYKDESLISEENYILMENSFIKDNHAKRKKQEPVEEEFEIDDEILKELL